MSGTLIGLMFGVGALLVWQSGPRRRSRLSPPPRVDRIGELLAQAGLPGVRPAHLWAMCAAAGVAGLLVVAVATGSVVIAIAFGAMAARAPIAFVRRRRRLRVVELRELWPDVVDNLASAVRAGMSLPEAVVQLGTRAPQQLRAAFLDFADDYRANGRFNDALDRLKAALADPVADRIVESLRVARDVGGTDLGRLLRTLSQFLRDDARTRAEIETRQGWTVNAARLALAAPWLVLALLSLRPETVAAYDSAAGVVVLAAGGALSFAAYRGMLRIARLPSEQRVLR
jgi:tight adherence protein B